MLSFRHTSISAFNAIRWEWFPCVARCELSALIGEGKREERCSSGYYTVSAMSFQLHFQLSHSPPTTTISAKKKLETVAKPSVRVFQRMLCVFICLWMSLSLCLAVFIAFNARIHSAMSAGWELKMESIRASFSIQDGWGGRGGGESTENLLLPYWPKFQWCIYKITLVHGYDRCFFV